MVIWTMKMIFLIILIKVLLDEKIIMRKEKRIRFKSYVIGIFHFL